MTREHEELCERLTANTEKYPGFENMNTQAAAAIRSLSEQVDRLAHLDSQAKASGEAREQATKLVDPHMHCLGPVRAQYLLEAITLALTNARVSALAARPEDGGGS